MDQRTMRRAAAVIPLLFVSSALLAGEPETRPAAGQGYAEAIERAHRAEQWRGKQALQGKLQVEFGGQRVLDGTILFDTSVGHARLELVDGTVAVFDGKTAWVSPASSSFKDARFHLLTWPYFLAVPMKLRDPGTRLEELGTKRLQDKELAAAKLTFASGTGDAPDDWYILYRDPSTGRLHAMAYIATYGRSVEEANKEPHAIVYTRYTEIDGVPVATEASFRGWSAEQGIQGEPIGRFVLEAPRFVTPAKDAFTAPKDAREDKLPG